MKTLTYLLLIITCGYACKQHNKKASVATSPDNDKADSLYANEQYDSAFFYYSKVTSASKDSLRIAMAYNSMAYIQTEAGDYYGSHESLLRSLQYLDKEKESDRYCLAADYNDLGTSCLKLREYDNAIHYYDLALPLINEEIPRIMIKNNTATAYQKKGQFNRSIDLYQSILDEHPSDSIEYARVLSNLAFTRWLQDSNYRASPELWKAMQIRKDSQDERGLNTSYAHLADYYTASRPDSSLYYAERMYVNSKERESPEDEQEALEKLSKHAPLNTLKGYFQRYSYLADSLQAARSSSKNQFALVRYDVQKNRTDNVELQKRVIIQLVLIYSIIGIAVMLIVSGFILNRKKQQRLRLEHENKLHEQQLRTSQKVHDVVANGLYRIMSGIEHQEMIDKEPLLDKIENLYERSRNISYDHSTTTPRRDFQDNVTELLASFASPETKVLVVGNDQALWRNVKEPVKTELETILQELMVNMKKHSAAQRVVVRFEQQHNQLLIQYKDDGVGLPANFSQGNGLKNTGNRILGLGGQIIFDKNSPQGLLIEIYLPIEAD